MGYSRIRRGQGLLDDFDRMLREERDAGAHFTQERGCTCSEGLAGGTMVECCSCQRWCHVECYPDFAGLSEADKEGFVFYCHLCVLDGAPEAPASASGAPEAPTSASSWLSAAGLRAITGLQQIYSTPQSCITPESLRSIMQTVSMRARRGVLVSQTLRSVLPKYLEEGWARERPAVATENNVQCIFFMTPLQVRWGGCVAGREGERGGGGAMMPRGTRVKSPLPAARRPQMGGSRRPGGMCTGCLRRIFCTFP